MTSSGLISALTCRLVGFSKKVISLHVVCINSFYNVVIVFLNTKTNLPFDKHSTHLKYCFNERI